MESSALARPALNAATLSANLSNSRGVRESLISR